MKEDLSRTYHVSPVETSNGTDYAVIDDLGDFTVWITVNDKGERAEEINPTPEMLARRVCIALNYVRGFETSGLESCVNFRKNLIPSFDDKTFAKLEEALLRYRLTTLRSAEGLAQSNKDGKITKAEMEATINEFAGHILSTMKILAGVDT